MLTTAIFSGWLNSQEAHGAASCGCHALETTDAGWLSGHIVMASEFMTKRYSATEILPTHTHTASANL